MGKSKNTCCVVNCERTEGIKDVKFYRFPKRDHDRERRESWVKAVNRKNPDGSDWEPTKNSFICSVHFQNNSPTFLPTIFPDIYNQKKPEASQDQDRFQRHLKRLNDKSPSHCDAGNKIAKKEKEGAGGNASSASENNDAAAPLATLMLDQDQEAGVSTMTPLPDEPHNVTHAVNSDNEAHKREVDFGIQNNVTKPSEGYSLNFVKNDDQLLENMDVDTNEISTNNFHGFHGYASIKSESDFNDIAGTSKNIFDLFLKILPKNIKTKKISQENRLLIFLMKMKHNLSYTILGELFGVGRRTTSKIFKIILFQLSDATASPGKFIPWVNKEIILQIMPEEFRSSKHRNCSVIINFSEFRVQMPGLEENREFMFSPNENMFSGKFLLGVSPYGLITFLSPVYGGRSSDCDILVESGLLALLEPNDEVLAVKELSDQVISTLEEHHVITILPPVNHGLVHDQGYDVSYLRLHAEKAIGRVKSYNILQLLSHDLFENIDRIVHMCCVLANLQPIS